MQEAPSPLSRLHSGEQRAQFSYQRKRPGFTPGFLYVAALSSAEAGKDCALYAFVAQLYHVFHVKSHQLIPKLEVSNPLQSMGHMLD